MRQKDKLLTGLGTPGAGIAISRLNEVDRPLVFRPPAAFEHLVARLVHLDEAAWWQ